MRQLGLAALMVASCAGVASGADRRTPPASAFAIEAPRDCGANALALPGSAGCVRLSGSLAVSTTLRAGGTAGQSPASNLFRTHVTGRVAADVRVPTDLGPLRVYTEIRVADPGGPGGTGHPR